MLQNHLNIEIIYPNISNRLKTVDPYSRLMYNGIVKGAVNIMEANFDLLFTKTRQRPTILTRYLIRFMLDKMTDLHLRCISGLTQEEGSADHSIMIHNKKAWVIETERDEKYKEYQKKLEIYLDKIMIDNKSIKGLAVFIVDGYECFTLEEVQDHLWEQHYIKFEY